MKAPRLLIGLLAAATLIQTAGASGAFVTGSGDSSPASGIFQSSGAGAAASPEAPLIEAAESQVPDPAPKDIRAVKNGSRVLISVPGHHADITFFPDAPGTVFKSDTGPVIHQGDTTARAYTVSVQPGMKFGNVDGLLLIDGGKKNGVLLWWKCLSHR